MHIFNPAGHGPQTKRCATMLLLATLAGAALSSFGLAVSSASAETLKSRIASALKATCAASTVTQAFLQWNDQSYYSLLPGGSFESPTTEWTLLGGAKLASGSETFAVTGALGKASLSLPAKASAESPFVCIGSTEDDFRLFLRSEASASTVAAEVVYRTAEGTTSATVGSLTAGSAWAPSAKIPTGARLATLLNGGTCEVALRFTATSGAARIDDVYLDPRMTR